MKKVIGIIGLGYVGAPLAYLSAARNYKVIGVDTDPKKIENINKRQTIPKQLQEEYQTNKKISLTATKNYNQLKKAEIIIICVPTPTIDNKPDTAILESVVKQLEHILQNDQLLIVESTIAPGMTKKIVQDELEKHNILVGRDYSLAYCPERIDPGNKDYWVGNINRVCGGVNHDSLKRAMGFYKDIIDAKIVPMNTMEEAELVKVWENSIRNALIAESNLLAKICDKKNFSVKRIIEGLNSKVEQFQPKIAYPGIGPGGHCIPEDIHYLIDSIKPDNIDMSFFEESVRINEGMPQYATEKLLEQIGKNNDNIEALKIVMLGISYKANTADTRRSQAIELYKILQKINPSIEYYDPIVDVDEQDELEKLNNYLSQSDVVILGCSHDIFKNIDFKEHTKIKYLLDCWNQYDKETINNLHINYIGIGE